ncbi:MAG: hypothetical protein IPP22_05480 [Nitrosomonas sp.]|nr:hypothetical protein [Nitrosomonas sp.]
MATNFFYVYALKDPRTSPARAFDHFVTPDATKKYARIKEIIVTCSTPMADILVEDLTEAQALRMEAELISASGTIKTGGVLTNAVVPLSPACYASPSQAR